MIIVEGPDGSGKTTLKDKLLNDTDLNLHQTKRHSSSLEGPIVDVANWVDEELWSGLLCIRCLYDRHALISEPIYGPITRNYLASNFEKTEWYLRAWHKFLSLNPVVIFCLPPLSQVRTNIHKVEQMRGVQGNIVSIYYQYHFLYLRLLDFSVATRPLLFRWDYTDQLAYSMYDHILTSLRNRVL